MHCRQSTAIYPITPFGSSVVNLRLLKHSRRQVLQKFLRHGSTLLYEKGANFIAISDLELPWQFPKFSCEIFHT